jgi:two-component system phosphate regulon sensor histidine kinase PhoR
MSRKFFIGLVGMMLLSIVGITWVQIIWIRDAVSTQNKNFNNAVFMSLNNAVREIEDRSRMSFFNNFSINDPFRKRDTAFGVTEFFSMGSVISSNGGEVKIDIQNKTTRVRRYNDGRNGSRVVVERDSSFISDSVTLSERTGDKNDDIILYNNRPGPPVMKDGVPVDRSEFVDWVRRRSNEFRNLSDQMISDIYEWERNLQINEKDISLALRKFFQFSGIQTPYDFALIKDGEVENLSSDKIAKNEYLKSNYKIRLFPDNMFNRDIVLSVVFPEKANYVLGSMAWVLGGSMLFSLFIFSTFGFSLWFILRQKKISEMKSDFINNMTHEFKTPIATISLAADTIINPKVISDEKSIRHFVGMIKKENSRMNKKVETILTIASLDKKEIEFRYEKTSLHSIIEKAVETIEIQVHQRQGNVRMALDAADDTMLGDAEHLSSLLHNLLDNAMKYSPEKPEITVSTSNRDEGIVLSVEDRGIGMSKSIQSKIFERFYRQTSGNVHDVKGFGLGLNYVKAIVDAHRGIITVTSEPGKGSRFDIYLPLNCES